MKHNEAIQQVINNITETIASLNSQRDSNTWVVTDVEYSHIYVSIKDEEKSTNNLVSVIIYPSYSPFQFATKRLAQNMALTTKVTKGKDEIVKLMVMSTNEWIDNAILGLKTTLDTLKTM